MTTKKSILVLLLLSFFISINAQDQIFIKYKDNVSQSSIKNWIQAGAITESTLITSNKFISNNIISPITLSDHLRLSRIYKVQINSKSEKETLIQSLSSDPSIEYVQESTLYKVDYVPNDSLIADQWGLEKVEAFDAWEISTGSKDVIIGVIDTGIDYLHEDLKNVLFVNSAEDLNGNGIFDEADIDNIDNDNNGFVDDVSGWDFTDRVGFPFDPTGGDYLGWDNDPMDEYGHGTNVAGLIGAESNNIRGISGIVPNAKIINLRAFDPNGYGEEDDVAAAILYAVDMGVDVINMSFGDKAFSYVLKDVIEYAHSRGVILVGSSGNSGSNLPHYPSGYTQVICVGATTDGDFISSFSNTGSTIDLVAPGSAIVTTALDNKYTSANGTSLSTPLVSGAAALLKAKSNFNNEEIKQILKTTSDDIDVKGWDVRSGAGRLNVRRALQITAPSEIAITYPEQDFSTSDNNIPIRATLLSPFFVKYNLYYGVGLNPEDWISLISDGKNQFANSEIYNLDISSFADTAYSFRLEVEFTNGRTSEERMNFYVDRTPPTAELVNFGPGYYGEKSTIFASVYTNELCVVNMFFRETGASEFKFVSLDGFTTNNKFVKQLHYGFIPKTLVSPNKNYEIYFEAENLVGLKTILKNEGNNFTSTTDPYFQNSAVTKLDYELPSGRLFKDPAKITSTSSTDVLLNENSNPKYLTIQKFNGNGFTKVDSIYERIAKTAGDFNNNGKTDLLSLFVRNGYIDEQEAALSASFTKKSADSSGSFWPILAEDIDNDGFTEVLAVESDTTITIHQIAPDLSFTFEGRLENYSGFGLFGNRFDSPNAVFTDADNDGVKEIWVVDSDGDLISYEVIGPNSYGNKAFIRTNFIGSENLITTGDFNNDGREDIAVLLQSSQDFDIAPFNLLLVFNIAVDQMNMIYQRAFIDPSVEFNSAFQKVERSIRFADVDNTPGEELFVYAFPYAYVFKNNSVTTDVIFYKEGVNSSSVFIGDLNSNGLVEAAFPLDDKIEFYEFGNSNKTPAPTLVDAYSYPHSQTFLRWNSAESFFRIFKGTEQDNLTLFDSTSRKTFVDLNVTLGETYYYAVQAYNPSMEIPYSDLSVTKETFVHYPAMLSSVEVNENKNLVVSFTDKIFKTIENIAAFEIINVGTPQSVSPSSENSYLLSYASIPVGEHKLAVKNLRDFYGSPIQTDTMSFTVSDVITSEEFFVSSHSIINSKAIQLNFNLDVDLTTIKNVSNYSFEPANSVTELVTDSENSKTVKLMLANPVGALGREYLLKISNAKSSKATGGIPIKEGAGSFVVLSSFADNISDVYVYPNPFKFNGNTDVLTFANLTESASVTIFTLSGNKVIELEENDGNGGLQWDLRDETGEFISSGIYIYRVVSLDENNNEIEDKIEKFAVIR